MSETNCYQRNKETVLNRATKYENNKERLREQAKNSHRELSEEKKEYKRRIWKK